MFNQKGEPGDPNIDSLIGKNTSLEGDVRFRGGLHVDGKVTGSLLAEEGEHGLLVVSEQGRIEGEIKVPEVIVEGTVEGDIIATDRVELREGARVSGNIRYGGIQMALGAQVNGQLICESKEPKRLGDAVRPERGRDEEKGKGRSEDQEKGRDEKSAA